MKIKTKISLRKLLIVVFCLSVLVIIVPKNKRYMTGIGFVPEHDYYYLVDKMMTTPTPRPVPKVSKSLEPPGIPSEYGWQLVSDRDKKINKIWWKNKSMTEFGVVDLPGNEWVYVEEVESKEDWDNWIFSEIVYDLESDGWEESSARDKYAQFPSMTIGDYMFFGGGRNFVTVYNVGFIKRVDDDIRVINYRLVSDRNALLPGQSSVDYTFPHMRQYRVFVSGLITEEEFLSNMETLNEEDWLRLNTEETGRWSYY